MKTCRAIVGVMMVVVVSLVGAGTFVSAEEIELVGTDDGEAIFEAVAEVFNQLHAEEWTCITKLPKFVNWHDTGMLKLTANLRLLYKPLDDFRLFLVCVE